MTKKSCQRHQSAELFQRCLTIAVRFSSAVAVGQRHFTPPKDTWLLKAAQSREADHQVFPKRGTIRCIYFHQSYMAVVCRVALMVKWITRRTRLCAHPCIASVSHQTRRNTELPCSTTTQTLTPIAAAATAAKASWRCIVSSVCYGRGDRKEGVYGICGEEERRRNESCVLEL